VRVGCGEGLVCCILTGSGDSLEALDLIGEFFCPSFIFFGDGTGEDALSDEVLGRYGYHYTEESGRWFAFPPFWWFASLFGCSSCRRVEVDAAWRQTPTSPAKRWPSAIFSACTFSDLLACWSLRRASLGASSNFVAASWDGGRLQVVSSGRRRAERSGSSYKDVCGFFSFIKGCLCKMHDANYEKKYGPGSLSKKKRETIFLVSSRPIGISDPKKMELILFS